MPKMGRIGGFVATGKIVHDDKDDWQGTFVNMTDVNDKLELDKSDILEQNTSIGWDSGSPNLGQEIYLEEGWRVISVEVYKSDSNSRTIRFRATWNGADIGGNTVTSVTGWAKHTLTPSYVVPTTGLYYVRADGASGVKVKVSNENYRGTSYCYVEGLTPSRVTSADLTFRVKCNYSEGSYESQSIYMDGATWGKDSWTENLDGATLVAKVRGSDNDIDWTEWQTLSNGDMIALGQKDYLQYGFWLTNATLNSYLDDIEIEYAI